MARTIKSYLKTAGHSTIWCSSAQSAINAADTLMPDVVILELQLPTHSGLEFLYEFRSYPEWQNIPIIVYTNLEEKEINNTITNDDSLGVSAHHNKSMSSLAELLASVEAHLSSSRL